MLVRKSPRFKKKTNYSEVTDKIQWKIVAIELSKRIVTALTSSTLKTTCKQSFSMYIHESVKLDVWNTCTIHFLWNHHIPVSFIWQRVTVQCVLITDHVSTYTIYHYIDVNIANQGHNIRMGYNNNDLTPYSFTDSAYRMSLFPGNTGIIRFIFLMSITKMCILKHIVLYQDENRFCYI